MTKLGRRPLLAATVGLLLALAVGCEPVEPSSEGPVGATRALPDIADCPDLRVNMIDPVDGKDCVATLQRDLQSRGLDQPVNGAFRSQTLANVKAFQRRNNINANGVVGPRTRAALSAAAVPARSFSSSGCAQAACSVVLNRSTTAWAARQMTEHPYVASAVSNALFALACAGFGPTRIGIATCAVILGGTASQFGNAVQTAAGQHVCVRAVVRVPGSGGPPVSYRSDNSANCHP